MSGEEIAQAFVTHYYPTLDTNAPAIAALYVSDPCPGTCAL
jgi:hypothetical protein